MEQSAHPNDAWTASLLGLALDNQKKTEDAENAHARAVALAPRSADVLNNYGSHLWIGGKYAEAEAVFSRALAEAPAAFNILYNLGVMASLAGHFERAVEALSAALRQQPKNVNVLFLLATAEESLRRFEDAVHHLALAAKFDPSRPDVQKLLALTAMELGALEDAAAAWDRYLELQPDDEPARRERGFNSVKMGRLEKGIAEIEWYLGRHPDDPVAHFELGQAERTRDVTKAAGHFNKALELRPEYAAARSARGSLAYQQGKPEEALSDLEAAASMLPNDPVALDRLGQGYATLDRPADAVRVLRAAAALAPGDSRILLHLGRALADSGLTSESKVVLDRLRAAGPEKKAIVPAGLVDYLSLSDEQRQADYRRRVEKAVRERPADAAAHLAAMKLALAEGATARAAAAAKRIAELKPGAEVAAEAGRALLAAKQVSMARPFLRDAVDLARADILAAAGKKTELVRAAAKAVELAPDRIEIYMDAVPLLIAAGEAREALRLLEKAGAGRDAALLKAAAGGSTGEIRNQWPEWSAAWAVEGVLAFSRGRFEDARLALETAVALGARGPTVFERLARSYAALGKKQDENATRARMARERGADDPAYLAILR